MKFVEWIVAVLLPIAIGCTSSGIWVEENYYINIQNYYINKNYRELIQNTDITAEELSRFSLCTPLMRIPQTGNLNPLMIPQLREYKGIQKVFTSAFVLGQGPVATRTGPDTQDGIGHYLLVKVTRIFGHWKARSFVSERYREDLTTMMFTFDLNGDLTAYHYYDGEWWVSSQKSDPWWPSDVFRRIHDLMVGHEEVRFTFHEHYGGSRAVAKKQLCCLCQPKDPFRT